MGIAAFPPVGVETWTEVATASPTSGSSVTLSSLPASSKLRIIGFDLKSTSASFLKLTINNDTSNSYAYGFDVGGSAINDGINLAGFASSGSSQSFDLEFEATNQAIYKKGTGYGADDSAPSNNFIITWANTAVINRFDVTLSAGTFTAGTIKVFAA